MKHGLQRSYYYYESRRCFWVAFLLVSKGLEAGLAYFAWAKSDSRVYSLVGLFGALASSVLTTCKAESRLKTLAQQMRTMRDCLGMMPVRAKDETAELYQLIKKKREQAERKDDVVFAVLDAMCYNKASMTLGATERYKIGFCQRLFGWWLPWPYPVDAKLEDGE